MAAKGEDKAGAARPSRPAPTPEAAGGHVPPRKRNERRYHRARRDRGAGTRERLIAAALDVFGRHGFEGASTRQIAKEADANLAAIAYHFGSKEALHLAVAGHIAARVRELVGPSLAAASAPAALASRAAARNGVVRLVETYADVLLGEAEAERWARFIVREQMQPTAAFDVLYDMLGGAHGIGARLVGAALGRDPEDEAVRLCTFALLGQVLVFRVAQAMVLRRMGWTAIGGRERAAIRRVVAADVLAILDHVVLP